MVKHTQTIRRQQPTNCLSVFDHFAGLALKGLSYLSTLKPATAVLSILAVKEVPDEGGG